MSTHYCEIHASGRIYNPPLLILRSATPLVLQLAAVRIYMPHPFPDLRASAFPSSQVSAFSVLRSTLLPVLRSLILSVCVSSFCDSAILILRFRLFGSAVSSFGSADSDPFRVCRSRLLPVLQPQIFSSRSYHPSRTSATAATRHWITMHVQMFHVKHFPLAPAARSDQRASVTYKRNSPPNMPPRRWQE